MNILNLFAGIGGNRTLWGNRHRITSVEFNQQIAYIYHERFPMDTIIIGDAYEYFLKNFDKFDFVWASPPCITHTLLVISNVGQKYKGKNISIKLPDLRLYSLILFCQKFFRVYFVIENVKGYYTPLIRPNSEVGRHYIWSNVYIPQLKHGEKEIFHTLKESCKVKSIDYEWLIKQKCKDKLKIAHNCVNPQIGKYILNQILKKERIKQKQLIFL